MNLNSYKLVPTAILVVLGHILVSVITENPVTVLAYWGICAAFLWIANAIHVSITGKGLFE